jgi:hypothetical protein
MGAAAAVAAVAAANGDLALVPATLLRGGPWWAALEPDAGPKIIARLPFVERSDHPAGLPVFVVSRAAPNTLVTEVEVVSVRVSGWSAAAAQALSPLAEVVAVPDQALDGAALLISLPQGCDRAQVSAVLVKAGASVRSMALVGSHATRYTVRPSGVGPIGR